MYQEPHLSFAMSGRENGCGESEAGDEDVEYAAATDRTKAASRRIEFRRLEMLSVERFSSPRVREKLWLACSLKMRSEVVRFAIIAFAVLVLVGDRVMWYKRGK